MTLTEAQELVVGTKVRYDGRVYDSGYVGQTGLFILYEEGECNMQDSIAVAPEKVELVTR
jgi:hypothetical protein